MLIPHWIILYFLALAGVFATIISQCAVLFTGKYPVDFHNFMTGLIRWQTRVNVYMLGLTDKYPPLPIKLLERGRLRITFFYNMLYY